AARKCAGNDTTTSRHAGEAEPGRASWPRPFELMRDRPPKLSDDKAPVAVQAFDKAELEEALRAEEDLGRELDVAFPARRCLGGIEGAHRGGETPERGAAMTGVLEPRASVELGEYRRLPTLDFERQRGRR